MDNLTKVKIVSAGLILLGFYYFYKQSKQVAETAKEDDASTNGSTTMPTKADWDKVLKKGSKGVEVGILQKALKTLQVDNDFGALTEARLKKVMNVTETSLNQYNKFINKK
jgi:hypothetical protein